MKINGKTNTDTMAARVERGERKMATNGKMNPQKIARVTGVLFLITFITAIPAAFVLYPPCWTTRATSSVAAPTCA
jgi:hypothetical protein